MTIASTRLTLSPELRQQYLSQSEAEDVIRKIIDAQLENAPPRLLDVTTGLLCDRNAQIDVFKQSPTYKELLSLTMEHADLGRIEEAVEVYFRCVMLSHRCEEKEPLLHDIQGKVVYELSAVGGIAKLQSFCKTARDKGYRWAWIDTCCIDQTSNVEIQKSVNSMFVWYRHSALTIVYLSDVSPSSKPGALAKSAWNSRGWTVQEFLAPKVVLFYQKDWTLYLDDRSPNHKGCIPIMQELADATGIDVQTLVAFHPGTRDAREKLQWVSMRVTMLQEDIAYSLFGIFGVHLPVIYGEKKQNALGRLLKEVVAQSGDTTALYWVGKSSDFNSCLPADIISYATPQYMPPSLSEDAMQISISSLRNAVTVELALKLYSMLNHMSAPRFGQNILRLPCFAFPVTEVRLKRKEKYFTYEVKADGLRDLLITTEDELMQFSPAKPARQTLLLVHPWNRDLLEQPAPVEDTQNMEDSSMHGSIGDNETVLRLIARLGQPFIAFLLMRRSSGEFQRLASDHDITAKVEDIVSIHNKMDVRTLQILHDGTPYKAPPCTLPTWSKDEIRTSVSSLRKTVTMQLALELYTRLDNLGSPLVQARLLHLPCIAFSVTEVSWRRDQGQQSHSTFTVKADGLEDLLITTEDRLTQFSRNKPIAQAFLLVRPWDRCLLELPDFVEHDVKSMEDWSPAEPSLDGSDGGSEPPLDGSDGGSESHLRGLRLMVHLGQPFNAFLLAQQRGGEYQRIASDHDIIAQVKDLSSIQDMDIRTLEII